MINQQPASLLSQTLAMGRGDYFLVDQAGRILILKNGNLLAVPFLDIQSKIKYGGEQGLLAFAFHPAYSTNGQFYVVYTAPRSGDSNGSILVLERYLVSSGDADQADPDSGSIVLTIDHPDYSNHNGGTLAFGNDGYLYWSIGDGGSGGDPNNNAQNLTRLLGKIMRIDVDSASPYAIPTSNPFYGSSDPQVRQEIWAYGLRNPWRLSFDRLTHDLYIGDVGQALREEVDFQPASSTGGENYGWRVMEGTTCYNVANPSNPLASCDQTQKVLPITEYDHSGGRCAITGGYVYRGVNFPSLYGWYFYADYCSHTVFGLYHYPDGSLDTLTPVSTSYWLSAFGEDEQGELYLADHATGKIYQIRYNETTRTQSDFDGDTKTDPAKFDLSTNTLSYLESSTATWQDVDMGVGTIAYVPRSDFDGDGKTDPAMFVPSANALWYLESSTSTWQGVYMGPGSYTYVAGSDFDGDGKTDPALFTEQCQCAVVPGVEHEYLAGGLHGTRELRTGGRLRLRWRREDGPGPVLLGGWGERPVVPGVEHEYLAGGVHGTWELRYGGGQ